MTDEADLQRRSLLRTAVAAEAVLGTVNVANAATPATKEKPTMSALTAFESQATLKPLAFDPAKLAGLSGEWGYFIQTPECAIKFTRYPSAQTTSHPCSGLLFSSTTIKAKI